MIEPTAPGGMTFVCIRGRRRRCASCGAPATRLCDFLLEPMVFGSTRLQPVTCDAPMCDDHRHEVGANVDHCPRHANP